MLINYFSYIKIHIFIFKGIIILHYVKIFYCQSLYAPEQSLCDAYLTNIYRHNF